MLLLTHTHTDRPLARNRFRDSAGRKWGHWPLAAGQDRWRERDADEGQCELNYGSLNVGLLCKVRCFTSWPFLSYLFLGRWAHRQRSSVDRFEIVIRIGLNRRTDGPLYLLPVASPNLPQSTDASLLVYRWQDIELAIDDFCTATMPPQPVCAQEMRQQKQLTEWEISIKFRVVPSLQKVNCVCLQRLPSIYRAEDSNNWPSAKSRVYLPTCR